MSVARTQTILSSPHLQRSNFRSMGYRGVPAPETADMNTTATMSNRDAGNGREVIALPC
jgi:hypothetical protein